MISRLKSTLRPYIRPWQRAFRKGKKDLRKLLLTPIRLSGVSSAKLGPPKGVYMSLQDWKASVANDPAQDFQIVAEAEKLIRKEPQTVHGEVHWLIKKEYERESVPAFIARISNGRVWVKHNNLKQVESIAVISEDDRMIDPLSIEFRVNGLNHRVFTQFKLGEVKQLKGRALCLASMKGEMFFHWILEVLPRIGSLQKGGFSLDEMDHIIVNSKKSRFMKDTLAMVGLPEAKLVDMQDYPHIQAEELLVPSMPAGTGNYTPWITNWLREHLMPHQANSLKAPVPRVFISRAKAKFRNVTNEAELERMLAEFGFQTFQLETMSYAEQIELFAQAEVIVAPHGAGLTHLFYCRPGTKVIEFFDPMYVNACFYSLANLCDLDYYYFLGKGKQMKEGVNLELNEGNITVDPEQLAESLALAGITRNVAAL